MGLCLGLHCHFFLFFKLCVAAGRTISISSFSLSDSVSRSTTDPSHVLVAGDGNNTRINKPIFTYHRNSSCPPSSIEHASYASFASSHLIRAPYRVVKGPLPKLRLQAPHLVRERPASFGLGPPAVPPGGGGAFSNNQRGRHGRGRKGPTPSGGGARRAGGGE